MGRQHEEWDRLRKIQQIKKYLERSENDARWWGFYSGTQGSWTL